MGDEWSFLCPRLPDRECQPHGTAALDSRIRDSRMCSADLPVGIRGRGMVLLIAIFGTRG